MFIRDSGGIYRSDILSGLPWVEHGFGSRESTAWPGDYTQLKQIHSNTVAVADSGQPDLGEGDALIVSRPGQFVGIRTADCVPLLIADQRQRVVGAVHAGWRGSAANIAAATVRRLEEEYKTNPKDLLVAIGPSIGLCCFEVGSEVAAAFEPFIQGSSANSHVDLVDVNVRQLAAAGLDQARIDVSGLCTVCSPEDFHSWRRERQKCGRMVAAIRIRST